MKYIRGKKNIVALLPVAAEFRLTGNSAWCSRLRLNPCDFYMWGNLKHKVYSNIPHTLEELKRNIYEIITSSKVSELRLMSKNIF
jgi:hypothetical protein